MTQALTSNALRAACPAADASTSGLSAANINPATGLATDYLNHFNEAIMLLDLVATVPECLPDLMAWRPLSYCDHFASSSFRDRDLAVAAYDVADPAARQDLERLANAMTAILLATRDGMMIEGCAVDTTAEAARAAAQLRPLVTEAGAVINGRPSMPDVDALFAR
jgi:hypothetical protein